MSGLKNHIDRSVTRYVVVAGFRIDLSLANMMLENILKTEWFEMLRYFIILRKYFSKSKKKLDSTLLARNHNRFDQDDINYDKKREILNSIVQFYRS